MKQFHVFVGINMSDDIDKASDIEQVMRDSAIHIARQTKTLIVGTGNCLNCDQELDDGRRWCDSYCRTDWEKWSPEA